MCPSKKILFLIFGLFVAAPPFITMVFLGAIKTREILPALGLDHWLYGLAFDSMSISLPYTIASFFTGGILLSLVNTRKINHPFFNGIFCAIIYLITPLLGALVVSLVFLKPGFFLFFTNYFHHYAYGYHSIRIGDFHISMGYSILIFGFIYGSIFLTKVNKIINEKQ